MSSLMAESLLIGSSNVYKIYKSGTHARDYKMIKCTKSESFEAHMTNLTQGSKFVLASVIENFVADEVTNEAEPDAEITHCVRTFLKTLGETATRLPGTKFCVVMPMQRPLHNWYQDRIIDLHASLMKGIKDIQAKIGYDRLAGIEASPESAQDFESDGVHLTEPSAKIFLEHILYEAEAFFKGGTEQHMDDEDDVTVVRSIEERLVALEKAHKTQVKMNFANNLMMARVREEIDSIGNRSKEDRVVMSGLKSKTPMPAENKARITWLKELAMKIFGELVPDFPGKIFYLSQGKQQDLLLPMVEIKLDKAEHALAIRKAFALKRKNKSLSPELESLFVTNCVNLATRVRIDILKAIARRITNDKDIAYVSGFISRPMMHIKKAGAPANIRPLKSFTFIDSVTRFHTLLTRDNLASAYERAGRAFQGQLENNFVVLNDEDQGKVVGLAPGTSGTSGTSSHVTGRGRGKGAGPTGTNATPRGSGSAKGVKRPGSDLHSKPAKK
jgi:hypothetical protein